MRPCRAEVGIFGWGFTVQGSGFRVQGLGFRVGEKGLRVEGRRRLSG